MNRRPLIAVSQRVDRVPSRGETRDALDQRLASWLVALGGLAVPVPNALGDKLVLWLKSVQPAAVLLSGGNDIGDSLERDRTEAALLDHAASANLPVLGICRGMQMLTRYAGGDLVPVSGHAGTRHLLHTDTVASGLLPAEVNSFHNWGVAVAPPDYQILATAPDGCVEAIRHRELCWEGWMWHPERESLFTDSDLARARRLLIGE